MKEFLIEQFTYCYDENAWFVALRDVVKDLTVEEALWTPDGSDKSVWKLLTHLNFYNDAWLIRFKGGTFKHPEGSTNDDTFTVATIPDEVALKSEISRMEEIMNGWREAMRTADEDRFSQPVSAENDATWASVISDVNTHTAYHTGQILLLRKLHGTWDPLNGVS